jgi:hypothetical protein
VNKNNLGVNGVPPVAKSRVVLNNVNPIWEQGALDSARLRLSLFVAFALEYGSGIDEALVIDVRDAHKGKADTLLSRVVIPMVDVLSDRRWMGDTGLEGVQKW